MLSAESYQNIISYLIRQLWRIFPKASAHTQIHKHTSTHHGFVMKVLSLLPCWYDKRKHNSAAEAHKQSVNLYSSDIEWFWHEISGVRGQESDGLRHPSSCVCLVFGEIYFEDPLSAVFRKKWENTFIRQFVFIQIIRDFLTVFAPVQIHELP